MTPTIGELREVGLRWNASMNRCYHFGLRINMHQKPDGTWIAHLGQRTLGEYWRRRRMVDFMRSYHKGWATAVGQLSVTEAEIDAAALWECRERRWKAWPKPGWKR